MITPSPGSLCHSQREGLCHFSLVSLDGACDTFLLAHRPPNLHLKVITGDGAMVSGVWLGVGSYCRAGEV